MSISNTAQAIVAGTVAAGAMDITAAIVAAGQNGTPARRVLQSVASGLLGGAAFEGGAPTAALGLALHFLIASIVTTLFVLLSRRFNGLIRRPWLSGPLWGIVVYAVMYRVVMPLSAVPWKTPAVALQPILIHVFCVGLPIALAAARFLRPRAGTGA